MKGKSKRDFFFRASWQSSFDFSPLPGKIKTFRIYFQF